jgi:hypothetical protein
MSYWNTDLPSFTNLECLLMVAKAIHDLGTAAEPEEKLALAWTLRNRLRSKAAENEKRDGQKGPSRAQGGEFSPDLNCDFAALLENEDFCALLGLVVAVWLDIIPDPTHGAVACHRHDTFPDWAKFRTVTALIGSQFFYT